MTAPLSPSSPSSSASSASSTQPSASAPTDERTLVRAVLALGVGGFSIGTGEFVIMGLLPEVARDIGVTIPEAGHVISAYALGVVVGAPVLAVLAANWGRRALLMALMAVYALGNFASALAPDYGSLAAMRLLTGLPHGTYFGVAALVAAALAPPGRRARAVGWVMLGLTSATLVGVPIAAALGEHSGWRAAFVFVGVIALAAVGMVRWWVPPMPASHGSSPLRELGALARKQVWLTLGIGAIGFGGMFAVFSYIKPTLIEVAGMPPALMPFVLSLFWPGHGGGQRGGLTHGRQGAHAHRGQGVVVVYCRDGAVCAGRTPSRDGRAGDVFLGHTGGDWPRAADPPDGRGGRCTNTGCRAQPFGLQCRQCTGRMARWRGHCRRAGLDIHRLDGRVARGRRRGHVWLGPGQ